MSKTALILMTALIPTTGHASLIRFASSLRGVTDVEVMINSRSFEPYVGQLRARDIALHFDRGNVLPRLSVKNFEDDTVPQNEEDHPHFWQWWAGYIRTSYPHLDFDSVVLIAAELYGLKVAEALGCDFMPYDIDREILPVKGTDVRKDMTSNWEFLLEETQSFWQTRVTLFGQESVGKSTLTQRIGKGSSWTALPEYARGYLEVVGSDLDQRKMDAIFDGQSALQSMHQATPFVIQDTDLYSTVGYAMLKGYEVTDMMKITSYMSSSDIYFVLPDAGVPFVRDQLRYGGDKRESSMHFWIDILRDNDENFVVVPEGSLKEKQKFIERTTLKYASDLLKPILNFVRD